MTVLPVGFTAPTVHVDEAATVVEPVEVLTIVVEDESPSVWFSMDGNVIRADTATMDDLDGVPSRALVVAASLMELAAATARAELEQRRTLPSRVASSTGP